MGFRAPSLIAPEAGEAHRRAQLPGAGLLRAGDFERTLEAGLRFGRVALGRPHGDFARNAMDLGFPPPFLRDFHRRNRFVNAAHGAIELADVRISIR